MRKIKKPASISEAGSFFTYLKRTGIYSLSAIFILRAKQSWKTSLCAFFTMPADHYLYALTSKKYNKSVDKVYFL